MPWAVLDQAQPDIVSWRQQHRNITQEQQKQVCYSTATGHQSEQLAAQTGDLLIIPICHDKVWLPWTWWAQLLQGCWPGLPPMS
jgi:hypothetical protein